MIYADGFKRCCYLILVGIMVDYKEQVLIFKIKANVQYSICHVFPQKRENLTRLWQPQIHKSIWSKFEKQRNNPIKQ